MASMKGCYCNKEAGQWMRSKNLQNQWGEIYTTINHPSWIVGISSLFVLLFGQKLMKRQHIILEMKYYIANSLLIKIIRLKGPENCFLWGRVSPHLCLLATIFRVP
jgi:hypothetical protein